MRAIENYVPATRERQIEGDKAASEVASALGVSPTPGNEPFDVVANGHGIEVKCPQDRKEERVDMRQECRLRKQKYARKHKLKAWTVAKDMTSGTTRWRIKEGVGAWRFGSMEEVAFVELVRRLKQK